VGHGRNFVDHRGELMYERSRAKRGSQLRQIGATALHRPWDAGARPGRADFPHPVLHERDSLAAA
jgi:hypothetical protein